MNFQLEIKNIRQRIPDYEPDEFDRKTKGCNDLYIYGAGFLGCKYADLLTSHGFTVAGFYETSCTCPGEMRHGFPVYPVERKSQPVVIGSFQYFSEMRQQLLLNGFSIEQIISPFGVFEKFYLPEYEQAFNIFSDELSQKIVIDKIKYHVFKPVMNPVSFYFNDEMFKKEANEVLVDGGAFDGETAKEFALMLNHRYKKIYCFEPTTESFHTAVENLKELERIEIINKGLYSHETTLKFKDFGKDQWNSVNDYFMGHEWNGPAMDYKVTSINVTALDTFFQDKEISDYPTMIKLDIEGSEREALLGMKNVINTSHPKLIICAYHKIEDYYELAKTIKDICPGYCLKLRHYTDNVLDSIIFASFQG